MNLDTAKKHDERQTFVDLAHPQRGVDAMKNEFAGTTEILGSST